MTTTAPRLRGQFTVCVCGVCVDMQSWLYINKCIVLFGKQSFTYVDVVRVIQHDDSDTAKSCSIIEQSSRAK